VKSNSNKLNSGLKSSINPYYTSTNKNSNTSTNTTANTTTSPHPTGWRCLWCSVSRQRQYGRHSRQSVHVRVLVDILPQLCYQRIQDVRD